MSGGVKTRVLALSSACEVLLDLDVVREHDDRDKAFMHWVATCRRCRLKDAELREDAVIRSADAVADHLKVHVAAGHKIGSKRTVAEIREIVARPLAEPRVYLR